MEPCSCPPRLVASPAEGGKARPWSVPPLGRGLFGRSSEWWANGRDGGGAALTGARPQRRHGIDGGGYRIGGLLVVDPPADEISPCLRRGPLYGAVRRADPGDGLAA